MHDASVDRPATFLMACSSHDSRVGTVWAEISQLQQRTLLNAKVPLREGKSGSARQGNLPHDSAKD